MYTDEHKRHHDVKGRPDVHDIRAIQIECFIILAILPTNVTVMVVVVCEWWPWSALAAVVVTLFTVAVLAGAAGLLFMADAIELLSSSTDAWGRDGGREGISSQSSS